MFRWVVWLFFLVISHTLLAWCTTVVHKREADAILSWQQVTWGVVSAISWSGAVFSWTKQESVPPYIDHTLHGWGLQFERVLERTNAYTRYQISYMSDGLRISGIMNIPIGSWPFPLVILNHGYIDPAVYTNGRGLKREQDYLARHGFAVLHTDYRNHAFSDTDQDLLSRDQHLRTQKYWSDALHAIVAIQEAVRSRYSQLKWVDADRVWMLWHSMWGGVTMYALVTHPDLIDAAVLYAPVHSNEYYNFNRWLKTRLDEDWYELLQDRLWNLTEIETFASFSPETYFYRITAPVQIYFWTADESCPPERWHAIRDKLLEHTKSVELIEYPGEKHEFTTQWISFMSWVVAFFNEHL